MKISSCDLKAEKVDIVFSDTVNFAFKTYKIPYELSNKLVSIKRKKTIIMPIFLLNSSETLQHMQPGLLPSVRDPHQPERSGKRTHLSHMPVALLTCRKCRRPDEAQAQAFALCPRQGQHLDQHVQGQARPGRARLPQPGQVPDQARAQSAKPIENRQLQY